MADLPDRYVSRKHESKVPCRYPDGRYVVAATYDPDLAVALTQAVLEAMSCPICHRPFTPDGVCLGEWHDVSPVQLGVEG